MQKFNLKFSGSKSEDPETSLTKLKDCRAIMQIDDYTLIQVLPFLLTGIAENWFHGMRSNWNSFNDLVYSLRSRFVSIVFQFELRQEIKK